MGEGVTNPVGGAAAGSVESAVEGSDAVRIAACLKLVFLLGLSCVFALRWTRRRSRPEPTAPPDMESEAQPDSFFTWDSGGSSGEYSFVHTAVELPKYPDGSISDEERRMLLLYMQNGHPELLLGQSPGAAPDEAVRGFLETIVEENSDDLRSPSECDEASVGWGSWDDESDDDRVTVVEMQTAGQSPDDLLCASGPGGETYSARVNSASSCDDLLDMSAPFGERPVSCGITRSQVSQHLDSLSPGPSSAFDSLWISANKLETVNPWCTGTPNSECISPDHPADGGSLLVLGADDLCLVPSTTSEDRETLMFSDDFKDYFLPADNYVPTFSREDGARADENVFVTESIPACSPPSSKAKGLRCFRIGFEPGPEGADDRSSHSEPENSGSGDVQEAVFSPRDGDVVYGSTWMGDPAVKEPEEPSSGAEVGGATDVRTMQSESPLPDNPCRSPVRFDQSASDDEAREVPSSLSRWQHHTDLQHVQEATSPITRWQHQTDGTKGDSDDDTDDGLPAQLKYIYKSFKMKDKKLSRIRIKEDKNNNFKTISLWDNETKVTLPPFDPRNHSSKDTIHQEDLDDLEFDMFAVTDGQSSENGPKAPADADSEVDDALKSFNHLDDYSSQSEEENYVVNVNKAESDPAKTETCSDNSDSCPICTDPGYPKSGIDLFAPATDSHEGVQSLLLNTFPKILGLSEQNDSSSPLTSSDSDEGVRSGKEAKKRPAKKRCKDSSELKHDDSGYVEDDEDDEEEEEDSLEKDSGLSKPSESGRKSLSSAFYESRSKSLPQNFEEFSQQFERSVESDKWHVPENLSQFSAWLLDKELKKISCRDEMEKLIVSDIMSLREQTIVQFLKNSSAQEKRLFELPDLLEGAELSSKSSDFADSAIETSSAKGDGLGLTELEISREDEKHAELKTGELREEYRNIKTSASETFENAEHTHSEPSPDSPVSADESGEQRRQDEENNRSPVRDSDEAKQKSAKEDEIEKPELQPSFELPDESTIAAPAEVGPKVTTSEDNNAEVNDLREAPPGLQPTAIDDATEGGSREVAPSLEEEEKQFRPESGSDPVTLGMCEGRGAGAEQQADDNLPLEAAEGAEAAEHVLEDSRHAHRLFVNDEALLSESEVQLSPDTVISDRGESEEAQPRLPVAAAAVFPRREQESDDAASKFTTLDCVVQSTPVPLQVSIVPVEESSSLDCEAQAKSESSGRESDSEDADNLLLPSDSVSTPDLVSSCVQSTDDFPPPARADYQRSRSVGRDDPEESFDAWSGQSKSTPDLRRCHELHQGVSSAPLSALLSKSVSQRIQDYLGKSSRALHRSLPPHERSRHYRRICVSTETVVERAARFEARSRSTDGPADPVAALTRSGSCPPPIMTWNNNNRSFGKPTATVRPTRQQQHPKEDLMELITGYEKARKVTGKPPVPPTAVPSLAGAVRLKGKIASARRDFFERLSQQDLRDRSPEEGTGLRRFDEFRRSAREERARLASSHPDLGALEAAVRSSRIDELKKKKRRRPGVGAPLEAMPSKTKDPPCLPYRRCTGEIAWASCAERVREARAREDRRPLEIVDAASGRRWLEEVRAHDDNDDDREEEASRGGDSAIAAAENPEFLGSRARSMDFLLDADNRDKVQPPENTLQGRVKSEHELRIERSLQNLTIPDWYKQSAWSKKPKEGFILRRGSEGSAGESRKRWQGFSSSRTPSATSLTTPPTSYSHRNIIVPKRVTPTSNEWRYVGSLVSSRESLTPASPASLSPRECSSAAFQYGLNSSLSRWSSSRLSTSSAPLTALSLHRSFRQPYLGWRAAAASSSGGGSRSSPGVSPINATTPLQGSRPGSPRRGSQEHHYAYGLHQNQITSAATLRPESGETGDSGSRISPLALYDNATNVFFNSNVEVGSAEMRRDRYSYTQSLYSGTVIVSPGGPTDDDRRNYNVDHVPRIIPSLEEDERFKPQPRVWMESSFVGTRKDGTEPHPAPGRSIRIVPSDAARDKFGTSARPGSSLRGTCATQTTMGEYVLRDFRRFGITL